MHSVYHSDRGKVESTNNQRDDRYHFTRVPAYGIEAQTPHPGAPRPWCWLWVAPTGTPETV